MSFTQDTTDPLENMESDSESTASECSDTVQLICRRPGCGEADESKLFICSRCDDPTLALCEAHWETWHPHKPPPEPKPKTGRSTRKSKAKSKPVPTHERRLLRDQVCLEKRINDWLNEEDGNKYSEKHTKNLPSFWFGADLINGTFHLNSDLYGSMILSSAFQDRSKQFPSLVSFIGSTGAGKSTMIKAIIGCGISRTTTEENTSTWARILTPIAGIKAFAARPTSSNVHLYHDFATIDTARPILFADSEGLSGGNQTPFGASMEAIAGIARKVIPWKQSAHKITREYCVEHIYPRILYAFSDVLCYVIQQDPRVVETLVSRMIAWADKARNASLNQVTLPRVILILNNVALSDKERAVWEDGKLATELVIDNLKACTHLSPGLQEIADRWNGILDQGDHVHSVMDLFLRYFQSISVVYMPPRGKPQEAAVFYGQVQRLRHEILDSSQKVGVERLMSFNQVDSRCLESLLNIGIEHFFNKLDEPFDFFQIARMNRPLSKSIGDNATYLMTTMEETEANWKQLDERCRDLFVSYRTMMVLSERRSGRSTIGVLEGTTFAEPFQDAHKKFYTSSRCWFIKGQRRCRNTREGHTKGHLDRHGEFIASGGYQTEYEEQHSSEFKDSVVKLSKPLIKSLNDPNSEVCKAVVDSHLAALYKEREFWKRTFSNKICLSCLAEPPDFSLNCGHAICSSCVKVFGHQQRQDTVYHLGFCPLCSDGSQTELPFARIQLKPDSAGVRILAIDGGGVRGVISARILQMLEDEIGLNLPLFHFFDMILGTSSGGIISLALGANLWPAHRSLEAFKTLGKGAFVKLKLTKIPFFGVLFSWLRDSYYDEGVIEKALQDTEEDIAMEVQVWEAYVLVSVLLPYTVIMKLSWGMLTAIWLFLQGALYIRCAFPVSIGLAVTEAPTLWNGTPKVDIALSVGTGSAEDRVVEKEWVSQYVVHGWLKRCIDLFESNLDAERLWRKYHETLDEEAQRRHHRLNVKLTGTLPFMADTGAIERMDKETIAYFRCPDAELRLRSTAEALLASLFYISVDYPSALPGSDDNRFLFRAQIFCRLEQHHQKALLDRLQAAGCGFLVHGRPVDIGFEDHSSRYNAGETFRQDIQWRGPLRGTFHIHLVFRRDAAMEKEAELSSPTDSASDSTSTPVAKYDISSSPFTWATS
ncbi:hypothetical protein BJX68DRAFT_263171 [Aspergillus pseudodeflectus]|uniref:Patatin-like phospholipase n=1 Tax=Aspergillus pseudodeflectus TaxID=176178 RepID=A0ABR4L0F8_9EURO